jgi:hypothetical protein
VAPFVRHAKRPFCRDARQARLTAAAATPDGRGTVVATIAPARRGTGADLRRILDEHPPDDAWDDDLRELRRFAGDAPTTDAWHD